MSYVSLRWGYLFVQPMAYRGSVWETCLETIAVVFALPPGACFIKQFSVDLVENLLKISLAYLVNFFMKQAPDDVSGAENTPFTSK